MKLFLSHAKVVIDKGAEPPVFGYELRAYKGDTYSGPWYVVSTLTLTKDEATLLREKLDQPVALITWAGSPAS